MARRKKLELPKPELNITSMMDLVLNLLTFFVLVSNFAAAELPAEIQPPQPLESRALAASSTDKITLNIIPISQDDPTGIAKEIKLGSYPPIPMPTDYRLLTEQLKSEIAKSQDKKSELHVDLRAHRNLNYDQIAPVMNVLKTSGISRVNVVAQVKD